MIRTIIIEDELPAANRLEKLILETDPEFEIVARLESVSESVSWLIQHDHPDLIMLDIHLADGMCFEIFNSVQVDAFVIFTTAYDEYAIRAFELNSIDYLLKPVDRDKLAQALEKFKRLNNEGTLPDISMLLSAIEGNRKKFKERFAVNVGTGIKSIETSEIAYFFSLEKNTFLCTREGRSYPVDQSLDRLEELLDPDRFFRINRQYIINYHSIDKVKILSRSRVAIHTVPAFEEPQLVSTAKTHAFRMWLDR